MATIEVESPDSSDPWREVPEWLWANDSLYQFMRNEAALHVEQLTASIW